MSFEEGRHWAQCMHYRARFIQQEHPCPSWSPVASRNFVVPVQAHTTGLPITWLCFSQSGLIAAVLQHQLLEPQLKGEEEGPVVVVGEGPAPQQLIPTPSRWRGRPDGALPVLGPGFSCQNHTTMTRVVWNKQLCHRHTAVKLDVLSLQPGQFHV